MKVKLVVFVALVVSTFALSNPVAVNAQMGNCTKAPPMYLHVGDAVMLSRSFVDGQRTTSMLVYRIVQGQLSSSGYIQTGRVFHIVSGPRCVDGWRFWELREMPGVYALDGVGQNQYFDIQQVSPTRAAPTSCALAPAPYISVGSTIRLSDQYSGFVSAMKAASFVGTVGVAAFARWDPNRMPVFSSAGSLQPISLLPKQQSIRVLGGPVCGSSFRYYRTNVGWVMDGINMTLTDPISKKPGQRMTARFFVPAPN